MVARGSRSNAACSCKGGVPVPARTLESMATVLWLTKLPLHDLKMGHATPVHSKSSSKHVLPEEPLHLKSSSPLQKRPVLRCVWG